MSSRSAYGRQHMVVSSRSVSYVCCFILLVSSVCVIYVFVYQKLHIYL
jgi:hypothetical protein